MRDAVPSRRSARRDQRRGTTTRIAAACLAAALAAALSAPAAAQDGWSVTLSPYAWTPGIAASVGTRFGELEADASVGDVLSALDLAGMGVVEARNGRWGLIADLLYADLTERRDSPFGALFSRARVDTELTLASGYLAVRLHEDARVAVDAMAGLRAVSVDLDVTLARGDLRARSFGVGDSWVDPLVGGRLRLALTDRWFAAAFADLGGFGGGSDLTWQSVGTIGYRFDDRWSAQGGWRQLVIEKRIDGRDVTLDLGGPLLGVTLAF
jgi:hypothetical protein